jgi:SAM-dependent methyltransferase
MSSYDIFGKFYDAVMGDRAAAAEHLSRYIRNASTRAKSVLELGCGTGSDLKHLASTYDVSGIDLSSKMLSIATRKVPQAKLFRQDMVRFRLKKRFDVICCVFDSINHILRFSDWRTFFFHVERHLVNDGCFIFDVTTQRKLDRHVREPAWVHAFGKNLLIMKVRLPQSVPPIGISRCSSTLEATVTCCMRRISARLHSERERSSPHWACTSGMSTLSTPTVNLRHRNRRGCTLSARDDRAV